MTDSTHHKIALGLCIIATAIGFIVILLPPTAHLPITTMVEMTKPEFPNTIFQHKDTGTQMTFFGTADNDYYYLKSVHDHHWIWSGTPQEFAAQFQSIERGSRQRQY